MNESKKIAPQYYILSSTTIHTPSPIQADVWFTQISIFFAISSKKCKNKNPMSEVGLNIYLFG